jgi:hypothetical protein
VDVVSQVQSTWTKLPISRDPSSDHVAASRNNKSSRANIMNLARLGRTFAAGLNPIRRMGRLAGRGRGTGLPAVWYSRDKEAQQDQQYGSHTSLERAKILKGSKIVQGDENDGQQDGKLKSADTNHVQADNVVVEEVESLAIHAEDKDSDVILESCGILATRPSQVLSSLLQRKKKTSSAEAVGHGVTLRKESSSSQERPKSDMYCNRNMISRQMKAKSLDIDDRDLGTLLLKHADRKVKKMLKDSPQLDRSRRESRESQGSGSITAIPEENRETYERPLVKDTSDSGSHTGSITQIPMVTVEDVDPEDAKTNYENSAKNGAQEQHEPVKFYTGISQMEDMSLSAENLSVHSISGSLSPSESGSEVNLDSWVNVDIKVDLTASNQSSNVQVFHPCMRLSLSDGSLAYHSEEMLNDSLDDMDEENSANQGSTLSKLRIRMSNLTLPSSPQQRRRQALNTAQQNKKRSQLRFKGCKTRILLL